MMVRIKKKIILLAVLLFVAGCFLIHSFKDNHKNIKAEKFFDIKPSHLTAVSDPSPQRDTTRTFTDCVHNATYANMADIQMFNVYNEIPFDNMDGGVWKQGWNVQVDRKRWTGKNKLKVFVVPHSHNDPGWKQTFEEYYESQTRHIFSNMVKYLSENSLRKFIWAEVSYLSLWWPEIDKDVKAAFKRLVNNGQVEIVTGGWVMTDEANSHYYSMIQQLTHGHQWLQTHLNYTPKTSWCIDPFGVSTTMPFLLKHLSFDALVIQRTHYSIKKYLAQHKKLEFNWRQLWDSCGKYDLLTHMMPFYSYDIPHTCGPDPKICCQFDFKRYSKFGLSCPWRVQPALINTQNAPFKADLLLDQYRKKAELYATNVLLIPLGDDFRYDSPQEWEVQFKNYEALFEYMNRDPSMNVQIQFGTLSDYFEELKKEKEFSTFNRLSGDFFTYADRDDHYWSGYFTSRPFYKRMDRELMAVLRTGEILLTLAWRSVPLKQSEWLLEGKSKFAEELRQARASLSLFQHHDGITGTAKDYVMKDYAQKLISGLNGVGHVIQNAAYFLLTNGMDNTMTNNYQTIYFKLGDRGKIPPNGSKEQPILSTGPYRPLKRVVVFNSLSWPTKEIITLKVTSYINVEIKDASGALVPYQVSPFCELLEYSDSCYIIYFEADLKALQLKTYFAIYSDSKKSSQLSKLTVYNSESIKSDLNKFREFLSSSPVVPHTDFSIRNLLYSVAFNSNGLLKAITIRNEGITIPIHLSFVKYGCRRDREMCGAYLFLPDGQGTTIDCKDPLIKVIEGKLVSKVTVHCHHIIHTVVLYHSRGADEFGIEMQNLVDIKGEHNFEIAMRLSTNINNGPIFYTDVNGYQFIKRQYHSKLPLQGNYYPMPTSMYIEDDATRATIVSAQPLGASSLSPGQIEIMQDRRLDQDDNLGLGQGVLDNRPTLHLFRLLVERRRSNCPKLPDNHHGGFLTVAAHLSMNSLLYPATVLMEADHDLSMLDGSHTLPFANEIQDIDIHVVSMSTLPHVPAAGLILHRIQLDTCFPTDISYNMNRKPINVSLYLPNKYCNEIRHSDLTFTHIGDAVESEVNNVNSMDLSAMYFPCLRY